MSDMLTRASQAVEDALASDNNHPDDIARAVLMAVREPDDAGFMAEAMNLDGPLSRGAVSAPEFFTAMIDAILSEAP